MNTHNSIIISGSSHEELAREISQSCGIPLIPCRKTRFANSEWNFKILENIRNKDVFLIQTGTFDRENNISINDYIIETIIKSYKRGIALCEGKAYVNKDLVSKAEFSLALLEELKIYK